jgi:cytoskeletal protein CcmA (bactofilin family)
MKRLFGSKIFISVASMLLIVIIALTAIAADIRSGSTVNIAKNDVIDSDLYIAATNVTIDGTVNGDVFVAGQNININGTVNGGISVAGQTITVNGKVSTGARIAGQSVTVGGNIGRDLIAASSDLLINGPAVIGGDLNDFSTNMTVNGHIAGNVRGSVSTAALNDGVDKNVDIIANNLTLGPSANIKGNLRYVSQNKANIQQGAMVAGTTNQVLPANEPSRRNQGIMAGIVGSILLRIFGFLAIFVIGLVLLLILKRLLIAQAVAMHDHPLSCLGWGALFVFVTPIAALIVMFTIIGFPLALLALVIWGILLYLSQIPVALLIGWLILFRRRLELSYGFMVAALALGLVILYIVSAIPVLGFFIWLGVFIFGLGSLAVVWMFRPKPEIIPPAT